MGADYDYKVQVEAERMATEKYGKDLADLTEAEQFQLWDSAAVAIQESYVE